MNLNGKLRHYERQWKEFFVTIYWLIWKRRNERVFENKDARVDGIPLKAMAIVSSFNAAKNQMSQVKLQGINRPCVISSQRGREGWVIVNVDGAYSHTNGKAGCGGIIKDHKGNILEPFMLNIQNGDPLKAELWACLMGLKRA